MSTAPLAVSSVVLERATRALLCASAAAVTLVAWVFLRDQSGPHDHSAMLMPGAHGAGAGGFLSLVLMGQVMTIAMMTPTFLRWLLVFADLTPSEGVRRARIRRAAALTAGYFAAWLAYSAAAAGVQSVLQHGGWLRNGRVAAVAGGALLILAGAFQLAPVKRACLAHCRNPLSFFLSRWRGGPGGGFRLGAVHGVYCMGCCWLLMATGLAMGVMNLAWMALLTVIIVAEQVLPRGDRVGALLGLAMAAWGLRLLIG
jgi:predicted metal-binding membrane protein